MQLTLPYVDTQAPPLAPQLPAAAAGAPELSVVIPTFNERRNVPLLIERLAAVLQGVAWEVIFVDDNSPDGTAQVAKAFGRDDARVRCIRRVGRRGLSGACLEGMLASQARYVAVMDADLQHDEALLAQMLEVLRGGEADLAVGSRYVAGGSAGSFTAERARASRVATQIAQAAFHLRLQDPMSGFFMLRREIVEEIAPRLSTQGFKILLDIVVTAGEGLRVKELPFTFRRRAHGESKLDEAVALEFLGLILAKTTNDLVSVRFLYFCFVGMVGVLVHFAALTSALNLFGLGFGWAHTLATMVAIASNFTMNNALTYRDQRLHGWPFVSGLLRFYLVSSIGALANVGVGNWVFSAEPTWWIAGFAGAVLGVAWNYVAATLFVWRTR
jgi:dolichol-phosphate mannosyltransferase